MKLVEKINVLHQSLLDNKGREVQNKIIEDLVVYAEVHFAAEEKQMLKLNYPGYQKHKVEHDAFTAKALDLQQRVTQSEFVLTLEVLSFLKNWLQDHILGTDKEYSRHFNLKGVY
jgi:hemerythrin